MNMTTRVSIAALGVVAGARMTASAGISTFSINKFTHIEIESGNSSDQSTHQNNNGGSWTDLNTDGYSSGFARAQMAGSLVTNGVYQADMESTVDGDIPAFSSGAYLAQTHFEVLFTLTTSYTYSMIGSALAFQSGDQDRFSNTALSLDHLGSGTIASFANVSFSSTNFNTGGLLGAGTYRLIADSTTWVDLGFADEANGRAATDFSFRLTEVPAPSGMLAILAFAGMVGTPRRSRR